MIEANAAFPARPVVQMAVAVDAWVGAQGNRLALWLPVMLGAGIALYFALPTEPDWWWTLAALVAALILLPLLRTSGLLPRALALALVAGAVGFSVAQLQTVRVDAPQLDRPLGPTMVTGRVVSRDASDADVRVILDDLAIEGLAADALPDRVRIRLTSRSITPPIGATITLLAMLNPPSEPVLPGGFDFRRHAFFQRLGAFGYAVSRPTELAAPDADGLSFLLERLRHGIADRIHAQAANGTMSAPASSVAVDLLTGDRSAISDDLYADMRRSGLAHLLAISGLHVGLIAGLVFFAIRAGLALSPTVALRWPIKKWAAGAAIVAAFAYMMLVGATVPTQRAFLMAGLVFFAVLVDRRAISLRLVALAAAAVLLISPASVTGPSFQMSFAAVLALVALYDGLRDRWAAWRTRTGLWRRAGLYLASLMITSFTATLATAPFVLFHFQETPVYGPLANLIAVPLTAAWIMPWGLAAYLLMPFGLEALALLPMGWGIDIVLNLAHWCANLPGAVVATPALSDLALICIVAGGLWLALWRGRARWLGIGGLVGAAVIALATPLPTILVSQDAGLIGLRLPGRVLAVSKTRGDAFTREQWARLTGAQTEVPWSELAAADTGFQCDGLGCIWQTRNSRIAFVFETAAVAEDCAGADLVIAQVPTRGRCHAAIVVDRFDVWRNGAYALALPGRAGGSNDPAVSGADAGAMAGRVQIRTVAAQTGHRPWSRTVPAAPAQN